MEPIRWNPRFNVGVPAMDAQHVRLLDLINALRTAESDDATAVAIAGMFEYATTHFHDEERLLSLVGYSELGQQQKEHRAFLKKTHEFASRALSSTESREEIATFLRGWLMQHILQSDMKYAVCIPEHLRQPIP